MMKKNLLGFALAGLLCALPSGVLGGQVYRMSMLPRHAPEEIMRRIAPLAEYLSSSAGVRLEPVVEGNFAEYEKKIRSGRIQVGYQNPMVYARVSDVHEVLATAVVSMGGDRFRGIIISHADSAVHGLEDILGKSVCIVGRTSAGGYLSQKLSAKRKGIDVLKDCTLFEAVDNKQENVIFSVYMGEADVGFIRESALHMADRYIPAAKIRVVAECAWLPNWALSVSRGMPPAQKAALKKALLALKAGSPVLKAMKIQGFNDASDKAYNPVRQALGMENR